MKLDKIILLLIIAVFIVIAFDMYTKYANEKRDDDIRALQIQQQNMLAMQELQNQAVGDNQGFLGGLLGGLPLIGGLF